MMSRTAAYVVTKTRGKHGKVTQSDKEAIQGRIRKYFCHIKVRFAVERVQTSTSRTRVIDLTNAVVCYVKLPCGFSFVQQRALPCIARTRSIYLDRIALGDIKRT